MVKLFELPDDDETKILDYAYEHYDIDFPYSLEDIPIDIEIEVRQALKIPKKGEYV